MIHTSVVVSKSANAPVVSVEEVKAHLRIYNEDLDEQVQIARDSALAYCEDRTGRSFRLEEEISQRYESWPVGCVRFDRQPVKSIESVEYYDSADALQTVASTEYRLLQGTRGGALLEFDSGFNYPGLFVRRDAVRIDYKAGYAADTEGQVSIPDQARHAVLLKVERDWGNATPREEEVIQKRLESLLDSLSWGVYR